MPPQISLRHLVKSYGRAHPAPSSFRKICEQIIKRHFGLNHVSLRIVGKTCRRNESEEYALLDGADIAKGLYFVREFCSILLAYLKRLVRKLHFTDIDDIVVTINKHIYLCSFLFGILGNIHPRIDITNDA